MSQGVTIAKTDGTARGQTSDRRVRWVVEHVLLSEAEAEFVLLELQEAVVRSRSSLNLTDEPGSGHGQACDDLDR